MEQIENAEAKAIEQIAHATSVEGGNDELIAMASAFVESVMMVHKIPCDFDGLSLNVLRDPDTHELLAVVLTPVDCRDDGSDPLPRFDPQSRVAAPPAPKLVLLS
jgi:hypothetical protein